MKLISLLARARPFRGVIGFVSFHFVFSFCVALAFVYFFNHRKFALIAHLWIVSGGIAVILMALGALVGTKRGARATAARYACALIPAVAFTLLLYLYALNIFSNSFWGRNISYQLVLAYTPSILAGKEPLLVGRVGIGALALGMLALNIVVYALSSRFLFSGLEAIFGRDRPHSPLKTRSRRYTFVCAFATVASVWAGTILWGINSDWLFWNTEPVVSFFRPNVIIFEPTPRRNAVGDRDELLRAQYPRPLPSARKKNIILIIVDSLRADHMQVYGYDRPTTPFLTTMIATNLMRKVEVALSTCSES